MSKNSFGAKVEIEVAGSKYEIFDITKLPASDSLPFSLKVLLENLLRTEDGANITAAQIEALANWNPDSEPDTEIQFTPARVIMQDFTGVPCIVDLATMREAIVELGGDPTKVNPLAPAELVIDHSVSIDKFASDTAFEQNVTIEMQRNLERYQFLKWGMQAFDTFKVVPPGIGIVHQVNLEYLGQVVFTATDGTETLAYCDSLVGTDSHTTMINGLGVMGWGVGGIEAEAAMLGQPVSMLIPEVVGSAADLMSRIIGDGFAAITGQPVIYENLFLEAGVARGAAAAPDGYTLLLYGSPLWLSPFLREKLPYDPVRDYAPVSLVVSTPNVMVVHPGVAAQTVGEFIALAKTRPGMLNYSSASTGSTQHLAAELFKNMAGLNIVRIPYKGSGPLLTDLIGGQIQYSFETMTAATPHVKGGKVIAVANYEPGGIKLFDAVTPGTAAKLAPILREFAEQRRIGGELFRGDWTDVGTVERLNQLNAPLQHGS